MILQNQETVASPRPGPTAPQAPTARVAQNVQPVLFRVKPESLVPLEDMLTEHLLLSQQSLGLDQLMTLLCTPCLK